MRARFLRVEFRLGWRHWLPYYKAVGNKSDGAGGNPGEGWTMAVDYPACK